MFLIFAVHFALVIKCIPYRSKLKVQNTNYIIYIITGYFINNIDNDY